MATVADQIVGRDAELDALDASIADLQRGEGAALLLVGEPGIGKTRLLAELAGRADARGCVVLTGSASELEVDLPFWVFVDALDEYAAGLDPRRLDSLAPDVRAELARVLPSLSDLAGTGEAPPLDERYRAHRATRELLERMAATKPLVLVLDDLHWADAASIELLGALLRRPPAAAVLLALAARPRQLGDRLAGALERAGRAGSLTRLDLEGLGRDDAGRLLGEAADVDGIYEESGGNPFYLEQLARARGRGRGDGGAGMVLGAEVPRAVAAALRQELALLSNPTRTLLQGAAVAGDPFEPDLAAAAAHVDEPSAERALDELLELDLVRSTDVPRRFRFRHPLVRRAVYESAAGGWRLGAHERCAAALAARGAPPAARAHHVEHGARQGDAEALAVMREAGREAVLRAPASAAGWFGAALRLLPGAAPPGERVELLLARAEALGAVGRLEESRADLLESLRLVPADAVPMRVRLTVACVGIEHMLGLHAEARVRVNTAIDLVQDRDAPEAVWLMIVLAFDGLFRTDFEAMREAAERALESARRTGDRSLSAMAAAVLTLACAYGDSIAAAEGPRAEAAGLIDAMTDEELAARVDAAAHLALAELYLDRYGDAGAHAERALSVGRATGKRFPTLVPTLATVRLFQGRLAEAARVIEDAEESARLGNSVQDMAWALHLRSTIALAEGDLGTAIRTAEEAVELTRGLSESHVSAYPGMGLAAALQAGGEPGRAADLLLESAGGEALPFIPGGWRTFAFELLARCRLDLGRREEAARAAAAAEDRAAEVGLPIGFAWAARATAAVALDAGDPAAAAERSLEAARIAEGVGAVLEAALARLLAGRALAAAGDEQRAIAELERAAAVFEECGALRHRDAAERELRKLGRHIHRRTRKGGGEGLESLSERELQVARLVVDRRTNRQIAAELFVSLKTVEAHMRNLFRKLDVSSRVEVARVVERVERQRVQGADSGSRPDVRGS